MAKKEKKNALEIVKNDTLVNKPNELMLDLADSPAMDLVRNLNVNGFNCPLSDKVKFTVIDGQPPELKGVKGRLAVILSTYLTANPNCIIHEEQIRKLFFNAKLAEFANLVDLNEDVIKSSFTLDTKELPTARDTFEVICYLQKFEHVYISMKMNSGSYTLMLSKEPIVRNETAALVTRTTTAEILRKRESDLIKRNERESKICDLISNQGMTLDEAKKEYNRTMKSDKLYTDNMRFARLVRVTHKE